MEWRGGVGGREVVEHEQLARRGCSERDGRNSDLSAADERSVHYYAGN
jgi:hypothetical protein